MKKTLSFCSDESTENYLGELIEDFKNETGVTLSRSGMINRCIYLEWYKSVNQNRELIRNMTPEEVKDYIINN